ncbi:PepSY-associated TM helix domain-containing protein [Rapidithrix thailandica]|uniref:PepSY-associated TM helix domain-containing protein n=1 Tax=Rapidithrix thailandica TaxID=413964 RepID=A0AAW9S6W3_9BACT
MALKFKRKTFYNIHSWVGITAGLLLFIICWSGSIAVFSNEIDWLLNPNIQSNFTTTHNQPVDWQKAYDSFHNRYPDAKLGELTEPPKSGYSINGWGRKASGQLFRFYLDPASYQIKAETTYFNVQRFFRSFHMSLFDPRVSQIFGVNLGYFIVGCFGLILMVSTITGFLFYKKWRSGFFQLNLNKGARRLWSDAHKLIGLWSLWFGLLIGITGTWYLLEWWLPEPPHVDTSERVIKDKETYLSIDQLTKLANNKYPELKIQRLFFHNYDKGLLSFEGDDGSLLVRKRTAHIILDTQSGKAIELQKPKNLPVYERWWETVDLLHFGNFAGLWSKGLYFIFGIALSILSLTGAYLQAQRQKLKSGVKKARKSIIVAYIFTVLILGLAVWGGINEITGYGINGNWPQTPTSVVCFIGLWIIVTVYILTLWMKKVK